MKGCAKEHLPFLLQHPLARAGKTHSKNLFKVIEGFNNRFGHLESNNRYYFPSMNLEWYHFIRIANGQNVIIIRHHLTINSLTPWLLGSEKNYVILSLVRSLPKKDIERNPSRSWLMEKLGFITDEHQINVALTRAKRGLCIIGKKIQV